MTTDLPRQDLDCPDPKGCTVAVDAFESLAASSRLSVANFPLDRHWYRVYDARDGFAHPNPGYGDTRFAPFDSLTTSRRIPTLYLAQSLTAALLESALHNVHEREPRVVAEMSLLGKLHARIIPPTPLTLVDLRDPELDNLGLTRKNISSSSSEHYPCTRRVARMIHASPHQPTGIIWQSRQAELSDRPGEEVAVVFCDRMPHARGAWKLGPYRNASGTLLEGAGRLLLDEVAESIGVTIVSSDELG